jgi:phosphoribosylaminoimidazole carboxylase (NCAIR synthetase)
VDTTYLRSLKTALTGTPASRLVLICNFEAEAEWATGHVGMPAPALSSSTALVRRMEELGVLLAGADDVLVTKHPLDEDYRSYLSDLGLPVPTVLVPEHATPDRPTAADALDSPALQRRLTELAADGARLLPMGTSRLEQELARACGLPLAVPGAATFERVNSKIYGRRLTEAAGLHAVPGDCCETVDELEAVLRRRLSGPDAAERIIVKDAYGVSGKGLLILDDPGKADRLLRMARRRAERTGDSRLEVVVENWIPKRCDLNYQVTITSGGETSLDFVKQALTENGVHKGHLMPADLTARQHAQIEHAAHVVGRHLHADGFRGVAGVDAIVGSDETIYPVLEINARLNMSTYQGSVTELLQPPGHMALAKHYPLRMMRERTFGELRQALGGVLEPRADERFIVTCFGTVNASSHTQPPFEGRLYALLVAPDRDRLTALDQAAQAALDQLPSLQEVR